MKYKTIAVYSKNDKLKAKNFENQILSDSNSLVKLHFMCENVSFIQFKNLINFLHLPGQRIYFAIDHLLYKVKEILEINSDIKKILIAVLQDFSIYRKELYYFGIFIPRNKNEIELVMYRSDTYKVAFIKIINLPYLNLVKY